MQMKKVRIVLRKEAFEGQYFTRARSARRSSTACSALPARGSSIRAGAEGVYS
jgi:hypothetical protein